MSQGTSHQLRLELPTSWDSFPSAAYRCADNGQYAFDDAASRFAEPALSMNYDYHYFQVQDDQANLSLSPSFSSSPTYPVVQDPHFIAQQTNQTLTALASARRQPPEYRMNGNYSQISDINRGTRLFYGGLDYQSNLIESPSDASPIYTSRMHSTRLSPPRQPRSSLNAPALPQILKTSEGHACSFCFKTFGRPSAVKIHMAIHTGEKAFTCPWPGCHRSFSVRSNMSRHIRNVHQSRSHQTDSDGTEENDAERT